MRRSRSRSLTSVRSVTVGDDSEVVVEDDRLHSEEATDDREDFDDDLFAR